MIHSQFEKLADLLINHSCSLEKGEKVLIEAFDIPQEMVIATIRAARKVGGIPFVTWKNNLILKELISDTTQEHMGLMGDVEKFRKVVLKDTGVSFCGRHHFGRPLKTEKDFYIRLAFSGINL